MTDESNREQDTTYNLKPFSKEIAPDGSKSCEVAPQIIPIAPNIVTTRGFRKLLLHREKLEGISKGSPFNQASNNLGDINGKGKETPASSITNPYRGPFADTHDYNILSARFNALFMWPLLLLTQKARSIDKKAPLKELVLGQQVQPRGRTHGSMIVQQHSSENSLNERQEPIPNRIVREDSSIVTKESLNESHENHKKRNTQKKQKKPAPPKRKRKKRSIESSDDSDNDESFDRDFNNVRISAKRGINRISTSDIPDPVLIGKDSLRKRKYHPGDMLT